MKKLFIVTAVILAVSLPVFAIGNSDKGGGSAAQTSGAVSFTIGATPVPHVELLNLIVADLAAEGITLKVIEYNDYVQPNTAVISGELDANFFQHLPYLNGTNPEWVEKLTSAFGVHIEPMGVFSQKIGSLEEIQDGAAIAIPNDPTNGGRALLLLAAQGLITLDPSAGVEATPLNIIDNPHSFRFSELEAAQLPRSLPDVDIAVINGNYALAAGLNPTEDAIAIEGADSPYVNIVVVKKGNENNPAVQSLKRALLSPKVKDYINQKWEGSVVAVF
ncbi:MAG: MetQ/NlpA family ABC transporter substrate-binding protein [Treponema sp.]|jgi:D-methionine transport system substrate-binding protein|nr:MetQ/NlpA family ABC transporter substrate-binding protein [Treponema sp.]